jgi:outer membrane protein OmpA-like peptidoglycan-associated protein
MRNNILILLICLFNIPFALSQKVILDGYVYEKNNRGYLNEVKVTVIETSGVFVGEVLTDANGHFSIPAEANKDYDVQFEKKVFVTAKESVSTVGKNEGEKIFVEHKMVRQPGYLLEVTLAEKRESAEIPVDAVNGSRIEIYNNTTKKEELVIDSSKSPSFNITLQQGNEYTILVRKEGFFNKRLHANVNINGCYLCMDGFGTVNPGVVDNLTSSENNQIGTLLANVEMERVNLNKNIAVKNIYYAKSSSELTDTAKKELDKVKIMLEFNPSLLIELGSHTDSRGSDEANLRLSQARAQAAVDYITSTGLVEKSRLKATGYGEKKLVNKCVDGAPCNEAEHIQNRRTELKIIGFSKNNFDNKSLLEIMHQEEMTQFLKSGESDKEYVNSAMSVTKAEEKALPKPIKKPAATEKPISKPLNEKNVPTTREKVGSVEPFDEDKPVVKSNIQVQTIATADKFDESPMASNVVHKTTTETPIEAKPTPITESKPKPISDKNLNKIAVNLKAIENYSGYKVQLFAAPNLLTSEDPDLKMIANEVLSDIFYEKLKNGQMAYSVGYFQGWAETERFLDKVITKYPAARIVEYYNGKRLGE